MRPLFLTLALVLLVASAGGATEQAPRWLHPVLKPAANGDRIPDFSSCGYQSGGVALPQVAVRATVEPVPGDAAATIQKAIDTVSGLPLDARGLRGAVLLRKGTYRIAGSLSIRASGVVLRGEGQGADGTVLIATGTGRRTLIVVGTRGRHVEVKDSRRQVADAYVPVGARRLRLDSTAGLAVGSRVIVHRPSTREWIRLLGMDRIPPRKDGTKVVQWTPGSKDLMFDRVLTAVDGNEITLDAPLTCALDARHGGGSVYRYEYPARISRVGVESLRGVSEYRGSTDEEHSWRMVSLQSVENGWVRQVTALHFAYAAVSLDHGNKWVTVEDCHCLDPISQITGSRRYSFNLGTSQLTLWQRCHARNGRHDFVTGATVAGPHVFLDCTAEKAHSDAGPHHRWAVGVLYDNVHTDGALNVRNRGNSGTGHGWAGANHVFWNCTAAQVTCAAPPGAHNWAVGCVARRRQGNGTWESFGRPVQPVSLYRAQLAQRLGR